MIRLLSPAILLAVVAVSAQDLNRDAYCDIKDCEELAHSYLNGSPPGVDPNGDGKLGIADVLLMGQWTNGLWYDDARKFPALFMKTPQDLGAFATYMNSVDAQRASMTAASLIKAFPDRTIAAPLNYTSTNSQYYAKVVSFFDSIGTGSAFVNRVLAQGVAVDQTDYPNFHSTFDLIHTSDLPVIFTADAMIEPLLRSLDNVLMSVEWAYLEPLLYSVLSRSREYLLRRYPAGESADDVRDVLETALKLLRPETPLPGVGSRVDQLVNAVNGLQMQSVSLFGRSKIIDFSQFEPRGHYVQETSGLAGYFKAMMWLSRSDLGFELSGSGTSARMKKDALIMWDCVVNSGAYADWLKIDDLIEYTVGPSDGLSIRGMGLFTHDLDVGDVRRAIDPLNEARFDTALAHGAYGLQMILSEGRTYGGNVKDLDLPRICCFMPQRFALDSYSFSQLVYPLTDLTMPTSLQTAFLLGDNSALSDDASLGTRLVAGTLAAQRALYNRISTAGWQSSLYPRILRMLMDLNGVEANSAVSPVFRSRAWQKKMRNAQLAGWAQLRAANLLYVKQSYSGGTCYFPAAYVEPYPAFFAGVRDFALATGERFGKIDGNIGDYFSGVAEISGKLAAAAQRTVQGLELTAEQVAWMNDMVTSSDNSTKSLPGVGYVTKLYDGWYFDLVYNARTLDGPQLPFPYQTVDGSEINVREFDPLGPASLFETRSFVTIADVHTKPQDETGPARVLHAATGFVQIMCVAVEVQGKPTLFVGPVSSYYDVITEGSSPVRLTKEEWRERLMWNPASAPRPPWADAFLYGK